MVRADSPRFEDCPPEALPGLLSDPERLVWVDLEAPTADEVAILSDVFRFHPLTIEDCLNRYVDPPKADDYGDYLFLVVQGVSFSEPAVADPGVEAVEPHELDVYLGRSYVVTFHQQPLAAIAEVRQRCLRAAPMPARGADWLAHALLDALVDQLLPTVEAMDEVLAGLEERVLARPERRLMEQLTSLRRSTLRLRRLVAPQRDLINRLARGDFSGLVGADTGMHYRDIHDHLVRLESMIEGLREVNDGAIAAYLAATNNRLSEVMKALSVAGTIFIPLTLVASVFGTNFEDTYFGWGWAGFLGMCGVMLAISAALLAWFRTRGWL